MSGEWCEFCSNPRSWHRGVPCAIEAAYLGAKRAMGACSGCAAKDEEIERLKSKTPHTSCWAEIETLKARVKKLMEYIRVAPHGGMCASIEHLNSYYADHPRPLCDCWKAAALEEK